MKEETRFYENEKWLIGKLTVKIRKRKQSMNVEEAVWISKDENDQNGASTSHISKLPQSVGTFWVKGSQKKTQ